MKAIVIGANGYIARHLIKAAKSRDIDVLACGTKPFSVDGHDRYLQVDLTNPKTIEKISFSADVVFVFSGLTGSSVSFSRYDEYVRVNLLGLLNLIEAIRKSNPSIRIVFPSSRLVYRGKTNQPLSEESEKECKTIYALTKLAGEAALEMYRNAFGLNYTIYRICVPYGNLLGNDYSYGTIGFMLERARKGEPITLFGDGSQKRTFTHISDICDAILDTFATEQARNQIFNVGGETFSLREIAQMLAEKYGVSIVFKDWASLDLAVESGDTIFDSFKLDQLLPNPRRFSFQKWLSSL